MNEVLTLPMWTQQVGQASAPVYVMLSEEHVSARHLVAQHVRTVLEQLDDRRAQSVALRYLGIDPSTHKQANLDHEIAQAYTSWQAGQFMILVDGAIVSDLDQTLALHEHSQVRFVRLVPLVGG